MKSYAEKGGDLSCFSLKIEGNHNKVIIGKRFRGKRVTLLLKGSGHLIEIGDHVWLGMNVFVGKNSEIADNSVVGWGSVVTRKFKEKGIVIAGNPAVKVKENINWSRRRPTRD